MFHLRTKVLVNFQYLEKVIPIVELSAFFVIDQTHPAITPASSKYFKKSPRMPRGKKIASKKIAG